MTIAEGAATSTVGVEPRVCYPIRILWVEDETDFREVLSGDLADRGFLLQDFPDGALLLQALGQHTDADVVFLDWTMLGLSSIELLSVLRQRSSKLPVIFLTGHNRVTREGLAFNLGAFDFAGKERGVDVLAHRLKIAVQSSKLGMTDQRSDKRYNCGKLVLDSLVYRAYWGGPDVGLTVGEYKIVLLLASNDGRAMSNRAIYDNCANTGFLAGAGPDGYRANVRSAVNAFARSS